MFESESTNASNWKVIRDGEGETRPLKRLLSQLSAVKRLTKFIYWRIQNFLFFSVQPPVQPAARPAPLAPPTPVGK